MQRSAVSRLTDVFGVGVYGLILLWSVLQTGHDYYFAFFTTKPIWIGDLILMTILTLWFGWLFVVQVYKVHQDHSGRWFFRNLGVYIPFLFWRILTDIMMRVTARLMVVAGWMSEHAYPGRGMRLTFEFEDEADFHSAMRSAKAEGLPLVDGRPIPPEEFDEPIYYHDEDILDMSLTFPAFAAIHVVDADPTDC